MGLVKIDALVNEIKRSKEIEKANYEDFFIGELFHIDSPKKKFNARDVKFGGTHPYVVRSNFNNGIKGFIDENIEYLNAGQTISFGQDTATMFYQENPYFTGDKIKIFTLKDKQLDKNIALFLISAMQASFKYFSWGKTKFDETTLKKVKVELPAISKDEPDWNYMDKYIDNIYIYIYRALI